MMMKRIPFTTLLPNWINGWVQILGKCIQFKIASSELTDADATDSEDVPQMAGALEPPIAE